MQQGRMITLGLDTSGPSILVCASDGEKIYSFHHKGIKQEQFLLPLVQRALAKAGASLQDVGRVFFVRGPGRFTGIRISLTFASMLASLNGAQVRSATLFDILRVQAENSPAYAKWKAEAPNGVLAVVLHAFREEYFLQIFDGSGQGPKWLSKEELLVHLALSDRPLFCVGTDKDGESLNMLLGDKYRLAPMADSLVRPQTLMDLSQNAKYSENALEPLYLKPARFELGR